MSKSADIERFMKAVVDKFGRIDILVNNAGTSKRGAFLELTDAEWSADIELKVFGAIRCTRLAVPHMKKQGGGRIINITISSAKQPGAQSYPTSVSRAAGLAITKALSKEFAADNILVNTVCIGKIKSGQHERRYTKEGISAEQYYATVGERHPDEARRRGRGSRERHHVPRLRCGELRHRQQHQSRRRDFGRAVKPTKRKKA